MESCGEHLIGRDCQRFHQGAKTRLVFGDQPVQIGGLARGCRESKFSEPLLDLGLGQHLVDFGVQLRNHVGRGGCRGEESEAHCNVQIWMERLELREVGKDFLRCGPLVALAPVQQYDSTCKPACSACGVRVDRFVRGEAIRQPPAIEVQFYGGSLNILPKRRGRSCRCLSSMSIVI